MASSPPSPLRQIINKRIDELVTDVERFCSEARTRARREAADQLNQAVRRIRQSSDVDALVATLASDTGPFATAALLFRVVGDSARSEKIELELKSAPALSSAAQGHDPVTAAAVASEVSQQLVDLLGHSAEERVSILPLVVRDRTAALLYCWGDVQLASLELLAQVASAVWTALLPATPLVAISPAASAAPVVPRPAWEDLSPDDQRTHLRAQRFARVKASEIRLAEGPAVQSGRTRRNLYKGLRGPIDEARSAFRKEFFEACPSMVDYLHMELVRTLANDDAELLGKDYPGPIR